MTMIHSSNFKITKLLLIFLILGYIGFSADPTDFITEWQVKAGGSITLPLLNGGYYDFTVDWGDGSTSYINTGDSVNKTHIYENENKYIITISEKDGEEVGAYTLEGWNFYLEPTSKDNIIDVTQWGNMKLFPGNSLELDIGKYFYNTTNLVNISALDSPDLNYITNMESMFFESGISTVSNIEQWDVSNVQNMRGMFEGATNFNGNISGWDVSSVTDMRYMFSRAKSFNQSLNEWMIQNVKYMSGMFSGATNFNQPLDMWADPLYIVEDMSYMFSGATSFNQPLYWDVSNVQDMSGMFYGATNFNGNISNWNTSKVTNMYQMFLRASSFNQSLNKWNVSNVENMRSMFEGATNFNGNISNWNTSKVTNMYQMFLRASSFNQDLNNWDVSNVIYMNFMFNGAISFNQPLNKWDVSNVIYMNSMFSGASSFDQPLNDWNVSKVTNMDFMFNGATSFNQPLNKWDVSNVTHMRFMFNGTTSFDQPLNDWNVSSVTDMSYMFDYATSFNQPLNDWDVSNVEYMSRMFDGATSFNQPLNEWDVSNVVNMGAMFYKATNFDQPLNEWDVSNVKDMWGMFYKASSFNQLLNNWVVSNVENMNSMFSYAESFNQPLDKWDVSNVKDMWGMFYKATSFNQPLGTWNVSNVTNMKNMFKDVKLSTENYDDLLIGWLNNGVQDDIVFDGGYSQYCLGESARESLNNTSTYNWTITDGGKNCSEIASLYKWDSIVYPEGIYEPYNSGAVGTRLNTFYIKFVNVTANETIDKLTCLIEQSNGNIIEVGNYLTENVINGNVTINYTILSGDNITKTTPWKIINCSYYKNGINIYTDNATYNLEYHNNSYNPRPILIKEDNLWTRFDNINDDAYRANRCFLGFSGVYFNNTLKCDYVGDVALAVLLSKGGEMDRLCLDCSGRYCVGIAYSCETHEYIGKAHSNTCESGICTTSVNVGGKEITYSYNKHIKPDGTLKVMFSGGTYNTNKPIEYAITDLKNDYYSSKSGRYNNTDKNTFYLDDLETTISSVVATRESGYTGEIDFVIWVNLSSTNYPVGEYNFSLSLTHYGENLLIKNIPINITYEAPDAWDESASGFGRDEFPCMNDVDEDLDYKISCADNDCWGKIGGVNYYDDSDAYCSETEICNDGFDNNRNGLTDCEEESCDLQNAKPGTGIKCHYYGEGNTIYDGGVYDWTLACKDGFNNDAEGGWNNLTYGVGGNVDCWDTTYCWGRGETSTTLPCPAFENNTVEWCFDGFDNNYDGLIDCENPECIGAEYYVTSEFLGEYNQTYYLEKHGKTLEAGDYLICSPKEPINIFNETEPERCFDGIDNNKNGLVDCADETCWGIQHEGKVCTPFEFNFTEWLSNDKMNNLLVNVHYCADSFDNDGNTLTDCEDKTCKGLFGYCGPCPSYEYFRWNSCADGIDNNGDGYIDCESSECYGQIGNLTSAQICSAVEICNDGFDNDGNGLVDCADPTCQGQIGPDGQTCSATEICDDGYDNTGNGLIDCMDETCWSTSVCASKSWTNVTNVEVPFSEWKTISGTTIEYKNSERLYVNENYTIEIKGTASTYKSVTIILGDATDSNKYFPYNATSCVLSGDVDKVKWVAPQESMGTIENVGIINDGFNVKLTCESKINPTTEKTFPIQVVNELGDGTKNKEISISSQVYENTAPTITGYEIAPNISGTIKIKKGESLYVRGIPENDVSGISECIFNLSGEVKTSDGNCMVEFENITESKTYTLKIKAKDGVSNEGEYKTYSIDIEVLPILNEIEISTLGNSYPFYNSTEGGIVEFNSEFEAADGKSITSCAAYLTNESGIVAHKDVDVIGGKCNSNFSIDELSEGKYHIYVIAEDSNNNEVKSYEKVFFNCPTYGEVYEGCEMADFDMDGYRDIGDPILGPCDFFTYKGIEIKINTPEDKTYSSTTLPVEIEVKSYNLNEIWYNWDGENVTYDGLPISFGTGTKTLHAWANDIFGQVNYTNVTFRVSPPSPDKKEDPTFSYEWDCETGLLEITTERDLDVRMMSLVDYSTNKGKTNKDGKIEFTLLRDGLYRVFTSSTSDYYPSEREITLEFCKFICVDDEDCPGDEVCIEGKCIEIIEEEEEEEEIEEEENGGTSESGGIIFTIDILMENPEQNKICQYESITIKLDSKDEYCLNGMELRIPELKLDVTFDEEYSLVIEEAGFYNIMVYKEGCIAKTKSLVVSDCYEEDYEEIIDIDTSTDAKDTKDVFENIDDFFKSSIKSGCDGFYIEGIPYIFCDFIWGVILIGSIIAAILEPFKVRKIIYLVIPSILSILFIPLAGAISSAIAIYLSYISMNKVKEELNVEGEQMKKEIDKK